MSCVIYLGCQELVKNTVGLNNYGLWLHSMSIMSILEVGEDCETIGWASCARKNVVNKTHQEAEDVKWNARHHTSQNVGNNHALHA